MTETKKNHVLVALADTLITSAGRAHATKDLKEKLAAWYKDAASVDEAYAEKLGMVVVELPEHTDLQKLRRHKAVKSAVLVSAATLKNRRAAFDVAVSAIESARKVSPKIAGGRSLGLRKKTAEAAPATKPGSGNSK